MGWAATIRLDDDATVSGEVLRVDDDHVIIGVPRSSVATIDGKPLPLPLAEGVPAPAFSVTDLAGKTQTVGKDQGRVTILHFWIHWCPHCRSDAPKIQALYDQYRENPKVQVITVSLDERRAEIDQFIKEHRMTYPVVSAAEQKTAPGGANLPQLYEITGFPITFLIDAQGIIRKKYVGSFVELNEDLAPQITELLDGPKGKPAHRPDHA